VKAMVLAAGIGSRLGSLTDEWPKALIEVGGVPLLELVLKRLIAAGVSEAIVNVFHKPDQIVNFLKVKNNFSIRIEVSRETELLDTGGGLKKASWFFDDGRPFFVHNVDVLSGIDLLAMYRSHMNQNPLATLAVAARDTKRYLLFDEKGLLCGRETAGRQELARPCGKAERLAFGGIHVVSPKIFPKMTETGVFPITKAYLRLAAAGERLAAFRADGSFWLDVGRPEKLEEARRIAREKGLPA